MAAPKGNKFAQGNSGGAPSKYQLQFNDQAYRLCLLGATDLELADFFAVDESTIHNWKKEHEEFFQSISEGKRIADMDVVVNLFQGAKDRKVIEQFAIKVKEIKYDKFGKKKSEIERVEIVEVEKIIPADFRNQSFWLRNRQSAKWRDKTEVDTNHSGNIGVTVSKDEAKEIAAALNDDV